MSKVKRLICCCCGSYCRGRQWWNRDTGFGICPRCVADEQKRNDKEGIKSSYGIEGEHYNVKED